jgi:hypothetical protein
MTGDRSRRMDAARVRAELTVQDLWLRYLSLGGTGDAFDLDGYLQGVMPLDAAQEDVLAQAVNEGLEDMLEAYRVPFSTGMTPGRDEDQLRLVVEQILDRRPLPAHPDRDQPGDGAV